MEIFSTNKIQLTANSILETHNEYINFRLRHLHNVLSSAVYNGGSVRASAWLNLKVDKDISINAAPEVTLKNKIKEIALPQETIGMMTAASMGSFRYIKKIQHGIDFCALVTTGFDNARAAGDSADTCGLSTPHEAGTINLVVLTSMGLSPAAMSEALMIATEAKVAALYQLGIKSRVSDSPATGTGTDSIAVFSDPGGLPVQFVGKHVLSGELLARSVIEAVSESALN